MKLFTCPSCSQVLHFENTRCERCGHRLAYLPELQTLSSLKAVSATAADTETVSSELVALAPEADGHLIRLCRNYEQHAACNWAVPTESDGPFCMSCALNEVIPNLGHPRHAGMDPTRDGEATSDLQPVGTRPAARTAIGVWRAGVRLQGSTPERTVFTGHNDGLITINIAEADDPFREKTREQMGEAYRTVLGHFRHEIGHYYWDRLVKDSRWLEPFRDAVRRRARRTTRRRCKRHYEQGAPADWPARFVSAYASMHPWEDWAETWAHYLHMVDTLETARGYGLASAPRGRGRRRDPERRRRGAALRRLRRPARGLGAADARAEQPQPQHGARRSLSVRARRTGDREAALRSRHRHRACLRRGFTRGIDGEQLGRRVGHGFGRGKRCSVLAAHGPNRGHDDEPDGEPLDRRQVLMQDCDTGNGGNRRLEAH